MCRSFIHGSLILPSDDDRTPEQKRLDDLERMVRKLQLECFGLRFLFSFVCIVVLIMALGGK